MKADAARRLMAAFALLALGSSAASTWVHYRLLQQPGAPSFCDVSAAVSCTQAYLSAYGTFAGVPVALAGLLWSVLVLALLAAAARGQTALRETVPAYVFLLSTIGLAFVLYLGYASAFVLRTFCILCVLTYAAVIGLFLVSGGTTTLPMTTLPRRAVRDLRLLLTTPAAALIAVLLLAGGASAVALFPRESPEASQPATLDAAQRAEFEQWYAALPKEDLPIDADGARVVIVKFNDYQCPPCRQTHEMYKPVLAKYEASHPGLVRQVTKDFPLEGECNPSAPGGSHMAACEAAVAVRLAGGRGQGDRMADWLFDNQPRLSPATVRSGVREVAGVDDFEAEYARVLEEVKADTALGGLLGVRSTPTFFINGRRIPGGGLPVPYLEAAIEWELRQ